MSGKIIILGCGNGAGTPGIGNYWGKCDPDEPKNRRTRSSILVQSENTAILVDTGPDMREQFNRHDVKDLDYILYTHIHADHTHGIDELRTLRRRNQKIFPCYGTAETMATISTTFSYMFQEDKDGFYPPALTANRLELYRETTLGDVRFTAYGQDHGGVTSLGFRFGNVAYSTDMKRLDERAFEVLRGVKTWIVDACSYHSDTNPVHAGLNEVYAMNERIGAGRVVLTHLSSAMDYRTLTGELPPGYEPAHDGMVIDF